VIENKMGGLLPPILFVGATDLLNQMQALLDTEIFSDIVIG
jgi:hypothetical protein